MVDQSFIGRGIFLCEDALAGAVILGESGKEYSSFNPSNHIYIGNLLYSSWNAFQTDETNFTTPECISGMPEFPYHNVPGKRGEGARFLQHSVAGINI